MRRIIGLVLVVCAIIVWGDLTLKDLQDGDAKIRQANQDRLVRVAQLQALERALDDLNTKVEEPITNKNAAAQTRLVLALQDQRASLWSRLDPLKEAIGKDPIRLEGVESQIDELGKQVSELIKVLGKQGPAEAQKVRQEVWTSRFLSVRKSLRGLSDQLQREVEEDWQATRLAQDRQLKRLIFGTGSIAACALLFIGVLLTRSKIERAKLDELVSNLVKFIETPADGNNAKSRLESLLINLRKSPVGPRFLDALMNSRELSTALVIDGEVKASSPSFRDLLGQTVKGQKVIGLFGPLKLETSAIEQALGQATGEWIELGFDDGKASTVSLRVCALTNSRLRLIELRDAREDFLEQSTIDQITEFTNKHLLTGRLEINGEVLEASESACSYLGASASDLKMAHLTDFDIGLEPERLLEIGQGLAQEGRWEGHLQLRRLDGPGLVIAQITRVQLENDPRETLSIIALAQDELAQAKAQINTLSDDLSTSQGTIESNHQKLIDERSRLTSEATQALQSFSRLMDLINTFGSEMRDPLNGAVGLTELLADTGDTLRVDQLRNVTDQLTNLVYSLLDHANLESESLPLDNEAINLEQLVRHVTVRYVRHLKGSDVNLELIAPKEPLPVGQGDSTRVTQIIDALVARSTLFALPGGLIRVYLETDGDGRPCCSIHDAGGPMPSTAIEELFALESYSGAAGARRWTGMEPAVLNSLAKAMGAQLTAELSNDEVMWKLSLSIATAETPTYEGAIPIAAAMAADSLTANETQLPPVVNASVLVADDDEVNRLVATGLLERAGCAPTVVTDGQEALDELAAYLETGAPAPFDLIVLDLMMPRLGGLETTQAIRSAEERLGIPAQERIPIIAITAKASEEDQQICLSIGMNGFVSKPYRYEELQALIARLVV